MAKTKPALTLGIVVSLLGFYVFKFNLLTNSNWWKTSCCYCYGHIESIIFLVVRGWIEYLVVTCVISVMYNSVSCLYNDAIFLSSECFA